MRQELASTYWTLLIPRRLIEIHNFFQKESAAQCESRNYVSLPFYYVLTTLAICLMILGRAFSAYEILILSLFLTTAPNLLLWRFGLGTALVLQVVFLSAIAFCFRSLSLHVVAGITFVSVAYTAYLILRNIKNEVRNWSNILGCLIFSYFNFEHAFRFHSPYVDLTDIVRNSILPGMLNTDDSMHMAIANMILHQHMPSTGLHMAPYLPYHYLGHFLIAVAAAITGLKVYDIFYFVVPLLFIPYMIFLFLLVAQKLGKRNGSFLLIPILLFGIPLGKIHPWHAEFDSTYPIGIIMMLSFLLLMLRKTRTRWVFAVMSAAYFAKVSVGATVSAAYALVNQTDESTWAQKIANLMIALIISLASFFCVIGLGGKGEGAFQWGAYYYAYGVRTYPFALFLWHQFSFSFIFCGLLLTLMLTDGRRALSERRSLILCWAAATILGAVAFNLRMTGGAESYFIDIIQWMLLPVLAALAWDILWHPNRVLRSFVAVGVLFLSLPLFGLAKSRLSRYRHYQEFHRLAMAEQIKEYDGYDKLNGIERFSSEERKRRFLPYFLALLAAGEYDERDEFLIEIPESETDFWQHSIYSTSRYWMAFYIPAISGRPAWNGYNYMFMKNSDVAGRYPPGSYGYGIYYRSDITDYCRNGRFRGVIRIAKDAGGIVKQSVVYCPPQPRIGI